MNSTVFGIEIILNDEEDMVTADSNIGLYNRTGALTSNASAGDDFIYIASANSIFEVDQRIYIEDDNNAEMNTITGITGNKIDLANVLANNYLTVDNAKGTAGSVFRWLQNQVAGVSNWSHTMLTDGGIFPFTRFIDIKNGGNIASPGAISLPYCAPGKPSPPPQFLRVSG